MSSHSTSVVTTIAKSNKKYKGSKIAQSQKKHMNETDWVIDVTRTPKLPIPSFIRLFIIRRVLSNHIDHRDTNIDIDRKINAMIKALSDIDQKMHQLSRNILHRLWNDGLKVYMNSYYKEEEQAAAIEMIFNDIILAQFAKEYQEIATYGDSNSENHCDYNNNYNKCLVFNTNDLMHLIFQYLHFWGELYNCTLVNTHWLCQIWNSTSLSHVDLTKLIKQTIKYKQGDENMCTRMWQRIVNVKHIQFNLKEYSCCNDLLLNRLSMLVNVKSINGQLGSHDISILKVLMKKCQNKIHKFIIRLDIETSLKNNTLSPLKLINANFIDINSLYFYIIWSIMCQTLIISADLIRKSWCEHVINKCDCSGIKSLSLDRIKFAASAFATTDKSTRLLLFKLAQKFKNVEELKLFLCFMIEDSLEEYFLASLCKIAAENNGKIELNLHGNMYTDHFQRIQINRFTSKNEVQIDKLLMIDYDYVNFHYIELNKTIATQMKDLEWVVLDNSSIFLQDMHEINIGQDIDEKNLKSNMNSNINCKFLPSLGVIEIYQDRHSTLTQEINELVGRLKLISQWKSIPNDLLIICAICCGVSDDEMAILDSIFAALYSLVMGKRVLVDIYINIRFNSVCSKNRILAKDQFWSKFNREKMKKEYKPPVLSEKQKKYCHALKNPIVTFESDNVSVSIHVANAYVIIFKQWPA